MNSFLIATRNLFGEKGRLLITAGGVAFSVTLILVLLGLYQGWSTQMTKFLGSIPAEFWIGQKGSRDISHSISILPNNLAEQLGNIDGVSEVNTFTGRQVSFDKDNKEIRLFLVGLERGGVIKPFKAEAGKSFPDEGEIILDKTTAIKEELKIGDRVNINGTNLEIAGISSGGNLLIYSYAFVNIADAREILDFQNFVNYYLVKASDRKMAKVNLESDFPNLQVMEKQSFLDNNTAIISETFLPIIGVLLLIALVIGVAVIGLTIYTATIEKSQEYGVLKAIGYTNGQLFSIAIIQSFTAGILGLIAGNILTYFVVILATRITSAFIFELDMPQRLAVVGVTILMSALAAFIPLKRLLSIDPANVFKA